MDVATTIAKGQSGGVQQSLDRQLPSVSVIIPARNRGGWLGYPLYALACQVYPAELVEILIIDDASSDNTEAVVRSWSDVYPLRIRFHRNLRNGPAASRNYGASLAVGEVLAFTDSDCVPDPHWLLNGVHGFVGDVGLVTGPLIPRRTADTHFFFNAQLGPGLGDAGLYRTANLFVTRSVFLDVGGFDETYQLPSGEDTDFGWRVKRAGRLASFKADAVVVHLATPVSVSSWLRRPVLARTLPRLLRTIPELRHTTMWHRYFHSADDFWLLVGVVGLAGAVALHLWVLALLPVGFVWWTRSNLIGMIKKGRIDKAAAMVCLLAARTACRVAVLSYASLRYRRLVL